MLGKAPIIMDHVYMSFSSFLSAHYLIAPSGVWKWFWGIAELLVRQRLQRMQWITPQPCEADLVVGQMLLESASEVMYYDGQFEQESQLVARFRWTQFSLLSMEGNFYAADLFVVDVDLNSKRMLTATLDSESITASDALTLVCFHTFFCGHPKIHAFATWGVKLEGSVNSYIGQCGWVTNFYNYLGGTCFARLMHLFHVVGVCRNLRGINLVFAHGTEHGGIPKHGPLRELQRHSEVVDFVVKVRRHFLRTFEKYLGFGGDIDAEAMFVGTVLHSLDHELWSVHLADALWLDVDSPRFGVMAEIGRLVKVGFTDDLSGLLFNVKFKNAHHPFFQEIYAKACKVNRSLADAMDICIAK
mmetsp:Transcript_24997/g.66421  ORF Transcript_24997/g.66421 Transcript_24997/m.66421 type:complete len:358 (+) Transcript_24997:217-1290(+)